MQPQSQSQPSTPVRVLLLDDDPMVLRGYARQLRQIGYTVETALDGRTALQILRGGAFDAVVSDITMPDMDGIAFLRELRTEDWKTPVLFLTAAPDVASAATAVELGAVRYLIKPAPIPELVRGIERAVELRRGHGPERQKLDAALTRALSRLWMAYQPIMSWPSGTLRGYEALVRSDEPGFGSPPSLLSAAERLDRLNDVGRAIRAAVARAAETTPGTTFFINLHPLDLNDPELVDANAPLSRVADRVVLEITERSSLDLIPDLARRIAALRALGYRIAVDDLGAGYAGLAALADLEPDVVKIDMSLTRGIENLPTKQRLVAAIITVCSDMGRELVCEGVETVEERDTLAKLGCRLFQGYLFARPARELQA